MTLSAKTKIGVCAAVMVAALVVLYMCNPSHAVWMPKCAVFTITGLKCPGCGFLRGTHALLHGDFAAAWGYNPMLPLLLGAGAAIVYAYFRLPDRHALHRTLVWIYVGLYLLWFVARNILGL